MITTAVSGLDYFWRHLFLIQHWFSYYYYYCSIVLDKSSLILKVEQVGVFNCMDVFNVWTELLLISVIIVVCYSLLIIICFSSFFIIIFFFYSGLSPLHWTEVYIVLARRTSDRVWLYGASPRLPLCCCPRPWWISYTKKTRLSWLENNASTECLLLLAFHFYIMTW